MLTKQLIFIKRKEQFFQEDLKENGLFVFGNNGPNCFSLNYKGLIIYNDSTFYALSSQGKRGLLATLIKNLKLFLKGVLQGYFVEFRIIGLGFKVKKSGFLKTRSLKFDLGYSHTIRLVLPQNIKIGRVKRRFYIFSNDFSALQIFSRQIKLLKQVNPYKLRGLKASNEVLKMKPGKKQTKR